MKSNNYNIGANSNCRTCYHLLRNYRFKLVIRSDPRDEHVIKNLVHESDQRRGISVCDFLVHRITFPNYDNVYMCVWCVIRERATWLTHYLYDDTRKDSSTNLEDFSNFPTKSRFLFAVNLRHDRSQPIVCSGLIGSSTSKAVENPRVLRDVRKIATTSILVLQTIESRNIFPQDTVRGKK